MKAIVGEHKCTIDKTPVNELEVNVTKVEFEFDEKIPASYAKKAFFTQGNVSKEVLLESNECDIPNEVLYQKGQVRLGVIAYEVQNGELIERFNPAPTYFPVWEGSLTEADNTEPITPTDKEQIESAIASIQAEQVTQNEGISQNTSDIGALREGKQDKLISGQNIKTINNESLLGAGNLEVVTDLSDYYTKEQTDDLLDDKADRSEIPDVSEFITKDVDNLTNYTKTNDMNTAINTAVGNERTNRESSDVALQNQIDAITASSDVVDVVSTYQDLLNYSTASLTEDDIIKVMQDESHSNAISYFRWQLSTWNYIGSEGPFYTKGETDTLLNNKANVSDLPDLTNYVKNTDYASSNKGGVIKLSNTYATTISEYGTLNCLNKTYSDYGSLSNGAFISKGTLENVITGKQLVNQTTLEDSQAEQDTTIEGLQAELERYKMLENALPHTQNETPSDYVTLNNTAKAPMEVSLTPQTSQETTEGNNKFNASLFDTFTPTIRYVVLNLKPNTDYTLSSNLPTGAGDISNVFIIGSTGSSTTPINGVKPNEPRTITSLEDGIIRIGYRDNDGDLTDEATKYWYMLNEGSTALPYEPFTNGPSPNPDYPQEIHCTTGENQVKVVGKNLCDSSKYYSVNAIYLYFDPKKITKTFTVSLIAPKTLSNVAVFVWSGTNLGRKAYIQFTSGEKANATITLNDDEYETLKSSTSAFLSLYLSGASFDITGTIKEAQIETGSSTTSFTPYEETTYPISLGTKEMFNINGVYDGFVYDESVDKFYINRKIGKVVLDGSENWDSLVSYNHNGYYCDVNGILVSDNNTNPALLLSNYFKGYSVNDLFQYNLSNNGIVRRTNQTQIIVRNDNVNSLNDFKIWLSSHNTTINYIMGTAILEEITDTTLISQLRAIKNALSMQGTTHIISTSTGTNLPFLIKARAVQNISNS